MPQVRDILRCMDAWAPFRTQMDFDNSGHLVGHCAQEVSSVLVSLDATHPVVEEAITLGANLIVTHHPVIFDPLRALTDASPGGALLLELAEHGLALISAHTNLDAAQGGVNDCLARALELREVGQLHQDGLDEQGRPYGIGRVGLPHRMDLDAAQYAAFVKQRLGAAGVRYVDCGGPVRKVAVGGGACGSMLEDARAAGCDTFVTADVKYHTFLEAKAVGINLMDAGHFPTERVVCPAIAGFLTRSFPELAVRCSEVHREVYAQV